MLVVSEKQASEESFFAMIKLFWRKSFMALCFDTYNTKKGTWPRLAPFYNGLTTPITQPN